MCSKCLDPGIKMYWGCGRGRHDQVCLRKSREAPLRKWFNHNLAFIWEEINWNLQFIWSKTHLLIWAPCSRYINPPTGRGWWQASWAKQQDQRLGIVRSLARLSSTTSWVDWNSEYIRERNVARRGKEHTDFVGPASIKFALYSVHHGALLKDVEHGRVTKAYSCFTEIILWSV